MGPSACESNRELVAIGEQHRDGSIRERKIVGENEHDKDENGLAVETGIGKDMTVTTETACQPAQVPARSGALRLATRATRRSQLVT